MSDVYARMAGMLGAGSRETGALRPGGWLFGDVRSAGHGALQVACDGLTLGPEEIRVAQGLSYTWTLDQGQDNYLRAGDRVLVLVTGDRQDYYLVQKAVFP